MAFANNECTWCTETHAGEASSTWNKNEKKSLNSDSKVVWQESSDIMKEEVSPSGKWVYYANVKVRSF